jgi:hypothetical protein
MTQNAKWTDLVISAFVNENVKGEVTGKLSLWLSTTPQSHWGSGGKALHTLLHLALPASESPFHTLVTFSQETSTWYPLDRMLGHLLNRFLPSPSLFIIHNHSCRNHHKLDSELLLSSNWLHIQEVLGFILWLEANCINFFFPLPNFFSVCPGN